MKCKNGVWSYENKAVDEDEKSSGFVTGYCKVSLPGMKVPAKFLKSLLRGGCLVYSFLGTSQGNSLRAKWILSLFQGVPVKGSSCANVADRLTGGGIRISYFLPSAVDRSISKSRKRLNGRDVSLTATAVAAVRWIEYSEGSSS